MCGIAGFISDRITPDEGRVIVGRMNDAQRHRGPDGEGVRSVCEAPTVVLGHRRLAIIDLSPRGAQPMVDSTERYWIAFNGEIYNFRDLRAELRSLGHSFHTDTDTEVILAAFVHWGQEAPSRLRGIFSFAIGDRDSGRVFLARDQMGVKPLYYFCCSEGFLFASEVRALLASDYVPRRLSREGLASYLMFGSVQEPHTLVDGVNSLPPGHFAWVDCADFVMQRYWSPTDFGNDHSFHQSNLEAIPDLLHDSIGLQMVSDVPLGCFLSGGIDSTAIAAEMQKANVSPVKSFSIIFDESKYDEREFSRIAASEIGTDHQELCLTGELVNRQIDSAISAFDQPSLDGINTYYVSGLVKEAGLTVALSGVGGDELFVGYDGFARQLQFQRLFGKCQHVPSGLRRIAASAIESAAKTEKAFKLASLIRGRTNPYFVARQVLAPTQITRLVKRELGLDPESWVTEWQTDSLSQSSHLDTINRISVLELQHYMLSTLLRDTDQMSMAHSLEVRVPLIDHCLVEKVLSVASHHKLDEKTQKPMLVHGCRGGIPDQCVYRPKRGFELPFEIWIRESLSGRVSDTMLRSNQPLFSRHEISGLWDRFSSRRVSWGRVWMLFILDAWITEHRITV